MQPARVIPEKPILSYPTFDLGLTPTPQPVQPPTHPPVQQPTHKATHHPISSHPTFDLGLTPTPPTDNSDRGPSSQSQSSQIPITQAINEPTNVTRSGKFDVVYPRRSKRVPKKTKCGTAGEKCLKQQN